MIDRFELYFSTVKILAQRPTHISAVATVLLITKTERKKRKRRKGKEKKRKNRKKERKTTPFCLELVIHITLRIGSLIV